MAAGRSARRLNFDHAACSARSTRPGSRVRSAGLALMVRSDAGCPSSIWPLPLVGRQANLVRPYFGRSDFPKGRRSDDQSSDHRCCNTGVRAGERDCAGARGRCSARCSIRCRRAGPGRSGRRSSGRLHGRTFDRPLLGPERLAAGNTPAAASPHGREPRRTAHARGDGSQRSDASCRQSGPTGSSRVCRASPNLGAARSGLRLRPGPQVEASGAADRAGEARIPV